MMNRDKFLNLLLWGNPHKWDDIVHWSDCAVYNEPAEPAGPCDCGAAKAHSRWWTYARHLWNIRRVRLQSIFRSRLRKLFFIYVYHPPRGLSIRARCTTRLIATDYFLPCAASTIGMRFHYPVVTMIIEL